MRGLRVLGERRNIPDEVLNAVESIRKNIRIENFKPSDLKKLINDPEKQIQEVARLVETPKPEITENDKVDAE